MSPHRRDVFRLAAGGALAATASHAQARPLIVFAAASLKTALDELAGAWARGVGAPLPKLSYAASGTLARQIEQGAPADLFVSADIAWMDHVAARGLVRAGSRVDLAGNRLVLIAPRGAHLDLELSSATDLGGALGDGRLAMGQVDSVPAGRYGKAALEKLGLWQGAQGRVVQADNVRAALMLVALGEAPLGIVFATDAAAEPKVRVVATFAETAHAPIVYPAALVKDGNSPDAARFLDHLRGDQAAAILRRHGFLVPPPPRPAS